MDDDDLRVLYRYCFFLMHIYNGHMSSFIDTIPDKPKTSDYSWDTSVSPFELPKGPPPKPIGPWRNTKQVAFALFRQAPKLYSYANSNIGGDDVSSGLRGGKKDECELPFS